MSNQSQLPRECGVVVLAFRGQPQATIAGLQRVFGIDAGSALRLYQSVPTTVKRTARAQERDAYVASLRGLGAEVVVQDVDDDEYPLDAPGELSIGDPLASSEADGLEWGEASLLDDDDHEAPTGWNDLEGFDGVDGLQVAPLEAHSAAIETWAVPLPAELPRLPGESEPAADPATHSATGLGYGELELDVAAPGVTRHRQAAPTQFEEPNADAVGTVFHEQNPEPTNLRPPVGRASSLSLPALPAVGPLSQGGASPGSPISGRADAREQASFQRFDSAGSLPPVDGSTLASAGTPAAPVRRTGYGRLADEEAQDAPKVRQAAAGRPIAAARAARKGSDEGRQPQSASPRNARWIAVGAGLAVWVLAILMDASVLHGRASYSALAIQAVALVALVSGALGWVGSGHRKQQMVLAMVCSALSYGANLKLAPRIEDVYDQGSGATGYATLRGPLGNVVRFPLETLVFVSGELGHMGRELSVAQLYLGGRGVQDDAELRVFGAFPAASGFKALLHKELPLSSYDFNKQTPSLIRFPGADAAGKLVQGRVELIDISRRGISDPNVVRIVGRVFMNVDNGNRIDAVSGHFEGLARWTSPVAAGMF